jgi:hypothetical protein
MSNSENSIVIGCIRDFINNLKPKSDDSKNNDNPGGCRQIG